MLLEQAGLSKIYIACGHRSSERNQLPCGNRKRAFSEAYPYIRISLRIGYPPLLCRKEKIALD